MTSEVTLRLNKHHGPQCPDPRGQCICGLWTDIDQLIRQNVADERKRILDRIHAGPPGWEDITGHGFAYGETTLSFDTDWIRDIVNDKAPELPRDVIAEDIEAGP